MRRPAAILGAVLTLALAAACATSEPASSATGPGSTPDLASPADPPAAGATVSPGVTAPEEPTRVPEILRFETPLVGGGTLRGAELAGAPVALWFWAPW